MSIDTRLQGASVEYQKLQSDLAILVDKRTRLDVQLSENEMVKKEFANLTPNNTVYKLVGPVLVPQDQNEAKSNVETRLGFIQGEISQNPMNSEHRKRVDSQIQDMEEKSEKKKIELAEIQSKIQQAQPRG
ncbi:Prefoldin [Scleroderma yunnanense]